MCIVSRLHKDLSETAFLLDTINACDALFSCFVYLTDFIFHLITLIFYTHAYGRPIS